MNSFRLRDYKTTDTICAIATFPSRSALGVIKVSGKEALSIVSKIFKPVRCKNLRTVKTFTLHYGWIVDKPQTGKRKLKNEIRNKAKIIDEVLVSVMRKPRSYTTEDVVEISCHGGVIVLNRILELLIAHGARLAQPGEFTYRAFLGGRIDMLQAESIAGIVDARTPQALTAAGAQLRGSSSALLAQLKDDLKDVFIETESALNFPEDVAGVCREQLHKKIKKILSRLKAVQQISDEAVLLREGVRCVICGRTNVGKSTLFNRLLDEERVIVSRFHGTTRDVIEEIINIRGVPLRMYDTAGILEPRDLIATKALQKTQAVFDGADLVILIIDGSRKPDRDDLFLVQKCQNKDAILVINKIDLPQKCERSDFPLFKGTSIAMSALKNIGLDDLKKAIYEKVCRFRLNRHNLIFLSAYQRQLLKAIHADLQESQRFLKDGYTIDFVNALLKNCLDAIGKLTGEIFCEEILESIFSQFCIGK